MMRLDTRTKLVLTGLSVWAVWGAIATILLINVQGVQPTSVSPENYKNGGPFITYPLACPANMPVSEGPTWRGITIGESSVVDLEEIYGVQVTFDPPQIGGEFGRAYSILLTSNAATERRIAQSAATCIVNGKIMALSLDVGKDEFLPSGWFSKWVEIYGVPELVTWSTGNEWRWRTVVWPQHGVAVTVDVGAVDSDPQAALVDSVTFFPFAQGDNYLSQWPYTGLNRQAPTTDNDAGDPDKENPFNFDAIMATPTANS